MKDEPWLRDMMDAALDDPVGKVREPEFNFLRQPSRTEEPANETSNADRFLSVRNNRRWLLPAAAAVLAAALATPLGIHAGRRSEERRINREIQEMFVDGLIGNSLFDEGLVSDGSETWFYDFELDEDFFEES